MAIRIESYKYKNGKIIMEAKNLTANGERIKIIKNKFVLDKPNASLDNDLYNGHGADLKTFGLPLIIKNADEYRA